MKKYIILFTMLLGSHFLFGQFAESVRSIRPGNTMGVWTVGQKVFQVQQFYRLTTEEYTSSRILGGTFGNLFRYGITERFEVQAIGNFGFDRTESLAGSFEPSSVSGISGLMLGARYHLGQPLGEKLFLSAFQVRFNLPHSSDYSELDYLRTTMTLALGQKILPKVGLNIAIGYQINSDESVSNRMNLGIRGSFRLNPKSTLVLEHFGSFVNDIYIDGFDVGLDYVISNNVKFDLSAGWRNFPIVRSNFGVIGITYRFHKRNNLN